MKNWNPRVLLIICYLCLKWGEVGSKTPSPTRDLWGQTLQEDHFQSSECRGQPDLLGTDLCPHPIPAVPSLPPPHPFLETPDPDYFLSINGRSWGLLITQGRGEAGTGLGLPSSQLTSAQFRSQISWPLSDGLLPPGSTPCPSLLPKPIAPWACSHPFPASLISPGSPLQTPYLYPASLPQLCLPPLPQPWQPALYPAQALPHLFCLRGMSSLSEVPKGPESSSLVPSLLCALGPPRLPK